MWEAGGLKHTFVLVRYVQYTIHAISWSKMATLIRVTVIYKRSNKSAASTKDLKMCSG